MKWGKFLNLHALVIKERLAEFYGNTKQLYCGRIDIKCFEFSCCEPDNEAGTVPAKFILMGIHPSDSHVSTGANPSEGSAQYIEWWY